MHMSQVHKEQLAAVDNALPNRTSLDVEIFGMEGVPEEVIQTHNQRVVHQFHQAETERQAATGNPPSGSSSGGQPAKKPKLEATSDLKKRLAEHKAKRADALTGGSSGEGTPVGAGQSAQTPGGFVSALIPDLVLCVIDVYCFRRNRLRRVQPLRASRFLIRRRMTVRRLLLTSKLPVRCIRVSRLLNSSLRQRNIRLGILHSLFKPEFKDSLPNLLEMPRRLSRRKLPPNHKHRRRDLVVYQLRRISPSDLRSAHRRSMHSKCNKCTWATQHHKASQDFRTERRQDRKQARFQERWTTSYPGRRNKPTKQRLQQQRRQKRNPRRKTRPSK